MLAIALVQYIMTCTCYSTPTMVSASLYHDTVQGVRSFSRSKVLQGLDAKFGKVIVYTNPPCIDCTWPEEHDEAVRKELATVGCCRIVDNDLEKAGWNKSQVTFKQTGVFIIDDLDADEEECGVAVIDMKYDHGAWHGKVPRELHMLKGVEVRGEGVTGMRIRAGALQWHCETEPCGHMRLMRPGNICWPVFSMSWDAGLQVTVQAPEDSPPVFHAVFFKLSDHNYAQLWYSDRMEALEFDGGLQFTKIARFQSGLAGALYEGGAKYPVEEETLERAKHRLRKQASEVNAGLEHRKTETHTVYSS